MSFVPANNSMPARLGAVLCVGMALIAGSALAQSTAPVTDEASAIQIAKTACKLAPGNENDWHATLEKDTWHVTHGRPYLAKACVPIKIDVDARTGQPGDCLLVICHEAIQTKE